MKYTSSQKLMIADGLPACLILTQAERKAAWDKNPPKSYSFTDPRIEQDKKLRAEQKAQATQKRIDALRQSKGLNPIYNNATNSTQPQETSDMPKFVIKPLDKHGAPVIRSMTSIKDDATQAEIYEKVLACVKRGGSKVATVLLEGADGKPTKAWTVGENEVAATDVAAYMPVADKVPLYPYQQEVIDNLIQADAAPALEVETEEADMAKKAKKKTTAKKAPKAKKVAGELRKGSKQEAIYNLLTRKSGCTTDEALKATGWEACGLTTWGKKFGLKVTKEKSQAGVTRYYGSK